MIAILSVSNLCIIGKKKNLFSFINQRHVKIFDIPERTPPLSEIIKCQATFHN